MEATVRQKIIAALLTAVLWLLAIVAMHFFNDVKEPLLGFTLVCQSIILLITGAHMGASAASSNKQTGYIFSPLMWWMLPFALGMALLTTGCSTQMEAVAKGTYTQAKAGVQLFDDNALVALHDVLCAQPYSAIQRHPEYQAGIVTLCGPLVNTASLSAEQLALLSGLYKQLGLQPAAIALPQPAK